MNNANLYNKANSLQRQDAETVIGEFASLVVRSEEGDDTVLDIGCGDGDVTVNILLKHLPNDFKKLTGCDLSPKMIKYARSSFCDPRIDFQVMDISAPLSIDQFEQYSLVFSFNCLHWVQDQSKALENIYNLMKKGGRCVISFGAKNPIYDAYKTMAKSDKWATYMKDIDKYISPYHYIANPEKKFKDLMTKAGFMNIQVECKPRVFYYSGFKILKDSVFAVNPFLESIPVDLHDDYFDDYVRCVRDMNLVEGDNNNVGENVKIKTLYHSLTAFATK